jgi:transcriptional regulator with XRE-family HTH domain
MTEHQVSDYAAEKIREARKQRGWNAGELAERCGLSGNIIENIESGRRDRDGRRRRDITIDELAVISQALNVGPLKLLPSRRLDPGEQEKVIQAVLQDLERDRARLAALTDEMARIGQERTALEDRVEKNQWLIEQLRQGNPSLTITVTGLRPD